MPHATDDAVQQLRICIIGAGVAGLTSALALAHAGFQQIDVYEGASDLGFVGAGIQMAPNMARVLDRLGVWAAIARKAVRLNTTSIRQGASDFELAAVDLGDIEPTYGYPHMVGHRATLVRELYAACQQSGVVRFHFRVEATAFTFGERPSFLATTRQAFHDPETVEADIVLACDGIKSKVRDQMLGALGSKDHSFVEDSGQAAYRIMLSRAQMLQDPELRRLIDSDAVVRWIGEKRHIIAYPIESKTIYNLSTAQPDINFAAAPSATYTTKGSKEAMLDVFADYCPLIQRMLALVADGEVCEWKLRVHSPLATWVQGSTALVGDASHPTLPHLAQGAAQAIEDASVLGTVLGKMPDASPSTIQRALRLYEETRKTRAEMLVAMAAEAGRAMHLGQGEDQEERDRQFARLRAGLQGPVPDRWADADVQRLMYGFDCVAAAERLCAEAFPSS